MKLKQKLTAFIMAAGMLAAHMVYAEGEDDPAYILESTAQHILEHVGARQAEFAQDEEALWNVVRIDLLPMLDTRYTARLILAKEGRKATPEQLDQFAETMSTMLIRRYASALLKYHDSAEIEVLPIKGELNPRMTKVRTRVRLQSGGFAPVDYAFRNNGEGWKAFDVIVEGISYVATFRGQIVPQVRAEGLDAVIRKLANNEIQLAD
jgi:phospholipid transport system substrate-binding protein